MEFDVEFYETEDGKSPAKEFILALDKKMYARTIWTIDLLKKEGNKLREPYSKYLEDGIFELRIKQGSDISRVLYFFWVNQKVILTNGFIKKTNKTPRKEVKKAKKYKIDFFRRKEK